MKIQTPGSSHTVTNAAHVALFVAPGKDYHWYRQNADGSWSHKRGGTPVIDVDDVGNVIWDPRYIDRNYADNADPYDGNANYDTFIGFYQVTPLNLMYQ